MVAAHPGHSLQRSFTSNEANVWSASPGSRLELGGVGAVISFPKAPTPGSDDVWFPWGRRPREVGIISTTVYQVREPGSEDEAGNGTSRAW